MNPICRECGTTATLETKPDGLSTWHCGTHGFRKLHQLNFVLIDNPTEYDLYKRCVEAKQTEKSQ